MPTNNPLNEYNSYSYHHFLVVAATTEIAERISNDSESFFRYLRGDTADQGVEILVNPLSSVRYVIQELSIDNIISGDIKDTGATSSNAYMEGKMTILEPLGIRFFNHIYDTYRNLGASTGGKTAVWMIKTIFIGHKDVPRTGTVEYITNIKPMLIQPFEITADFTEAGGRYDITFVMLTAGSGMMRMSNSNALTVGSTINLSGGRPPVGTVTLQQALQSLEARIRSNYESMYAKELVDAASPPEKVSFKINLAERLKDPSYIIETTSNSSAGGNGSVPIYSGGRGERLDQTIGNILKMCPKLVAEAAPSVGTERWLARVISNSIIVDPEQNNGYRTIEEFNILSTRLHSSSEITDGNYLEFDYMYTGKNVDVLSYDMKMNFAIAFFERITATGAATRGQSPAKQHLQTATAPPLVGNTTATPLAAPTVVDSGAAVHSVAPQEVATYEQLLQQQLAVENVAVNMTIRGNPVLLNDMIVSKADLTTALAGNQNTTGVASGWLTGPTIVRVNVMMPTTDTLTDFEKFWYDGVYRIIAIKHKFAGGEFTQELEMVSMTDSVRPVVADNTEPRAKVAQSAEEPVVQSTVIAEPTGDRVPVRTLNISQEGVDLLKQLEGWRTSMYLDSAGKPTIGYGHLLTDTERSSGTIQIGNTVVNYTNTPLTLEQGEQLLRQDLAIAEGAVKRNITANLYQREYDALVSFTFNVGGGRAGLAGSTLRTRVNNQQYTAAPDQFRRWNKETINGVKVVNAGLVNRRNAEIAMWGTSA